MVEPDALAEALREALSAPLLTIPSPPVALAGGFSRVMLRVPIEQAPGGLPAEVVVRILPDVAARDREVAFQATLARHGFDTIDVLATGDGNSRIGPFTVMPFVTGRPFVDLENRRDMLGAFRRVPGQLAETMLALHAVDPMLVRQGFGATIRAPDLDAILDEVASATIRSGDGELIAAFDRLASSRPDSDTPAGNQPTRNEVVCHGDLHPANLFVRADGAVLLLDWELAILGPAEFDLARTVLVLELLPAIAAAARPLLTVFGRRTAAAFLATYRSGSPYDPERLAWCRAVSALRLLTVVLGLQRGTPVARNWAPTRRQLRRIALESPTSVRSLRWG